MRAAVDNAGPTGAAPAGEGSQASGDVGDPAPSRWPLIAGIVVTLATLFGGGGFLWWRNRDSAYWPA